MWCDGCCCRCHCPLPLPVCQCKTFREKFKWATRISGWFLIVAVFDFKIPSHFRISEMWLYHLSLVLLSLLAQSKQFSFVKFLVFAIISKICMASNFSARTRNSRVRKTHSHTHSLVFSVKRTYPCTYAHTLETYSLNEMVSHINNSIILHSYSYDGFTIQAGRQTSRQSGILACLTYRCDLDYRRE